MLLADLRERQEKRVVVNGTDAKTFREFLSYIYFHDVKFDEFTEEALHAMFALAHQYQVEALVSAISRHMLDTLKVENVLGRLVMAELYDLCDFQSGCWSFVEAQTLAVIQDDSFFDLPKVGSRIRLQTQQWLILIICLFWDG
jgi:hypothetical protein